MAWNDDTASASVPGNGGRPNADGLVNGAAPQVAPVAPPPLAPPPAQFAPAMPASDPQFATVSPLPGGAMPGQAPNHPAAPAGQRPARPRPPQEDHRDDIWVDRARKAIAETQNDPYRQVQLLQQLNRLYLKERFNRDVKGDSQSEMAAEKKI